MARASSYAKIGVLLLCGGAVLAGGTAAIAAGLDHAGDAEWTNLGLANALGWTAVAGGATLVGVSVLTEDRTLGVTVRGRF